MKFDINKRKIREVDTNIKIMNMQMKRLEIVIFLRSHRRFISDYGRCVLILVSRISCGKQSAENTWCLSFEQSF